MPLTEGDVLNTLGDAITATMDFWVGPVRISGKSYGILGDHIRARNILVVGGTSTLAFYSPRTDVLTTQVGNSPANLQQRALLLHECTHALVDVFTSDIKVTRHIDELSCYIAQHVYAVRSNPATGPAAGTGPWPIFFNSVAALVKRHRLDTLAGNGSAIKVVDLEPLRLQLAALPGVNYGQFDKDAPTGADGLIRNHFFLGDLPRDPPPVRVTARESSPGTDVSDDHLVDRLLEKYAATDVAGYGARLRALREHFAVCSLGRAKELTGRLAVRRRGDRLSELFHDRLSREGRAILLRVLDGKVLMSKLPRFMRP